MKKLIIELKDYSIKNNNCKMLTIGTCQNTEKKAILEKFYKENEFNGFKLEKKFDGLLICSYNVHEWINLIDMISPQENFDKIMIFLSKYDIDLLVLQEVGISDISLGQIINRLKKMGFIDYLCVPNGGKPNIKSYTSYLLIMGKQKFQEKYSVNLSVYDYIRECPIIKYNDLMITGVHLEIGERYHHLPENNIQRIQIEQNNYNLRIKQLSKILDRQPIDLIIGDFNFSPNDEEFRWLLKNGYTYSEDYQETTPFNRTDMIFGRKIKFLNNITIKCNYSDHLPIMSQICL